MWKNFINDVKWGIKEGCRLAIIAWKFRLGIDK